MTRGQGGARGARPPEAVWNTAPELEMEMKMDQRNVLILLLRLVAGDFDEADWRSSVVCERSSVACLKCKVMFITRSPQSDIG